MAGSQKMVVVGAGLTHFLRALFSRCWRRGHFPCSSVLIANTSYLFGEGSLPEPG